MFAFLLAPLLTVTWSSRLVPAVRCLPRAAIRLDYIDANGRVVRSSASSEEERKRDIMATIALVDAKLDEMGEKDNILRARTYAELGMPPKKPVDPTAAMGGALTYAPAAFGILAVGLFLLNGFGMFGDGGDVLDNMAAEMTARAESAGERYQ